MINLQQKEVIYFIGIGGIGMSALARYFNLVGKQVMGYDRTSSPLTTELEMEGIPVGFKDSVADLPSVVRMTPKEKVLVVYTPAVPKTHRELNWFVENDYQVEKRSKVLGAITQDHKTIAVAGTHGKTTTTSLIAHILHDSGHGCNAFLGGITANYSSNLIFDQPNAWYVVEADEFDRSFLALSPDVAVITSLDADHLDIYGTPEEMVSAYQQFADLTSEDGYRLVCDKAFDQLDRSGVSYGSQAQSTFRASDERPENDTYVMDLETPQGTVKSIPLPMPGEHNKENVTAAVAVALHLGVEHEAIRRSLATFKGVKRRFEYQQGTGDIVFIDDYAHHPEELKATIEAAKQRHPGKRVTGVFQPHLFSRTKDNIDGFARSLELLDSIFLLDIYPAREEPIPGVDSQWLLDKINAPHKKLVDKSALLSELKQDDPEVLLTLGAGDIDRMVEPIRIMLKEKELQ